MVKGYPFIELNLSLSKSKYQALKENYSNKLFKVGVDLNLALQIDNLNHKKIRKAYQRQVSLAHETHNNDIPKLAETIVITRMVMRMGNSLACI